MSLDRLVPFEAGIVNLWDYHLQTFRFEGGRLVLRGANGSGKTKALEVLFPFVFDGQLDARRLDPFSGDSRSMRDNLLWGRDTAWAYAWLELRSATGRAATVGVGMRATRDGTDVKRWWFAVDRARGDGWDVVDGAGAPVVEKALKAAVGEAFMAGSARDHRANVDRLLFGLGERYDAMVDLVLALRRPMLAKTLDLPMLDQTLRSSLRPVEEELVERSARAFEDLEAVAVELDRLRHASAATDEFLGHYRTYLLSNARKRLDDAAGAEAARTRVRAEAAQAAAVAEGTAAAAVAARAAVAEAEQAAGQADQRVQGLQASDAYRGLQQLEDLRGRVGDARAAASRSQQEADAARRRAEAATTAGQAADDRLRRSEAAHRRADDEVAAAARDAGVDAAQPGSVEARRLEIRGVRSEADAWQAAETKASGSRRRAEDAAERAEAAAAVRDRAGDGLERSRDAWREAVAAWAEAGPELSVAELDAVDDAIDDVGEPGAPSPAEVLAAVLRPRRDALVAERQRSVAAVDDNRRLGVEAEVRRSDIAAERDADPPPARSRPGRTDADGGAPLWRLVDFAPAVAPAVRSGLESALLASGLLDAWVTPDGLASDRLDAFAVPSPLDGATLADVLVPDGDLVPADVVAAVLRSVALDEGTVSVGATGRYRLGPLVGAAPVEDAGYIGTTARARRRERRLAELDAELARLAAAALDLAAVQAALEAAIATLDRAAAALPSVAEVARAARALAEAAARAATLAERRREAEAEAEADVRAAADRRRRFVDAAGRARLAATVEALQVAEEAIVVLQRAVGVLATAAKELDAATERAAEKAADLDAATIVRAERDDQAATAAGAHQDLAARLAAVEDSLGADAAQVAADIARTVDQRDRLRAALPTLRSTETATGNEAAAAGVRAEVAAAAVDAADGAAATAVALVEPFARPALALACGLDPEQPWRDALAHASRGRTPSEDSLKQLRTTVIGQYEQLDARLGGRHPSHFGFEDTDLVEVTVDDETGAAAVAVFGRRLADQVAEQAAYLSVRERTVFEDALLTALVDQLHQRTDAARDLVAGMNEVLVRHRTSSGLSVSLSWLAADGATGERRDLLRLLEAGAANLHPDELDRVRRLLADEVRAARAAAPEDRYRDVLSRVLDYRAWRTFELALDDGTSKVRLTRQRYGTLSGGEKSVALHLPLFAAAHATFAGAHPDCPRLIALDEAFEGIDETGRDELLALTVAFDLDLFLTGYRLWVTSPRVPAVAHYELVHDSTAHIVAAQRIVWNGAALVEEDVA